MKIVHVPRKRDEQVLHALALRLAGFPWSQIAARIGVSIATISQACRGVRDADVAASCPREAQDDVLRCYR